MHRSRRRSIDRHPSLNLQEAAWPSPRFYRRFWVTGLKQLPRPPGCATQALAAKVSETGAGSCSLFDYSGSLDETIATAGDR